jgi:hypothetical protein
MPRGGEKSNAAKYELGTTNQILEIFLLIINALQRQDREKIVKKSKNPRFSNSLKETWVRASEVPRKNTVGGAVASML